MIHYRALFDDLLGDPRMHGPDRRRPNPSRLAQTPLPRTVTRTPAKLSASWRRSRRRSRHQPVIQWTAASRGADEMTSSETASHHQVMPENDQDMPDLDPHPGGAPLAGDPESPGPRESGYPGVTPTGGAAEEPGVAGTADAAAPFAFSRPPVTELEPAPAEPFAFSTAPVTEPEPAPSAPHATDGASPGTRWPEIQAMFVDDPRLCAAGGWSPRRQRRRPRRVPQRAAAFTAARLAG